MTISLDERIVTLPDEYESPTLRAFASRFSPSKRGHVLDLGRPSTENLNYFAGLHCRVSISDFFGGLTEAGFSIRRRVGPFGAACKDLLDFSADSRFDLVVVWDLFNYLTLEEIGVFMQQIGRYCPHGSRLMVLLSIYQRIPDRPFRCLAIDGGRVRCESESSVHRESPRHTEHGLLSRLGDFEVETSVLLRGGMQEYGFYRS